MNFSRNLSFLFGGALIGIFSASWFGPQYIAWWIKPPVEYGINCDPSVAYSMKNLILVQSIAALVFALIFLVIKMKFFSSKPATPVTKEINADTTTDTQI